MNQNEIIQRLSALEAQAEKYEAQSTRDGVRLAQSESRLAASERKLKVTWAVSTLAACAMLTLGWHKDAIAQGYGMTLAQAATRIAALETKTASMSIVEASDTAYTGGYNTSGYKTVRFTGVNVQIVDGQTPYSDASNGTGNLIIGYNEKRPDVSGNDTRTGSHNLVVGGANNYSGKGGVVTGVYNTISGSGSTVTGGRNNTASGNFASVSGGYLNVAGGDYSSVSGGYNNNPSGQYSSISGGTDRIITTDGGWVAGRRSGTSYTGYFNSP